MSRDFDARVRDLHESPLDISSVKGKARTIRRNRRVAVAGGILGVAAMITPVAVLASNGDPSGREPDFAPSPTETAVDPAAAEPDYILDGVWHQADGDQVQLARQYDSAVAWNDQLVATRFDGEAYFIADVINEEGTVVDTFDTMAPVVVNDTGTTIAWVDTNGEVMTQWDDEPMSLGTVDLAAAGEGVPFSAVAVSGGPDCNEAADGCVVYVESGLGGETQAFTSAGTNDIVAPGVTKVFDATDDGVLSVITQVTEFLDTCSGLYDVADGAVLWETCDYQIQQVSPDGGLVAAPQSQYDGPGPTRLSVLDAASKAEVGTFERNGWTVGQWEWSPEGSLVFTAYENGTWHLMTMAADGTVVEDMVPPVPGDVSSSAFRLVRH